MYNDNLCMARKNTGDGVNMQCSYKRKHGQYCGFHKDKRLRIDEPLPSNYKTYLKNLPKIPIKKHPPLRLKTKIEIINHNPVNRLITLNDYLRGVHLKCVVKDLRYSLAYYGESSHGRKSDLLHRLSTYFNEIAIYQPHLDKILMIQRNYRKYLNKKILKIKGPGYFDRSLCLNDYDFYTCQDKTEIEDKYFISYKDAKSFTYCFDVRSLEKLIENGQGCVPINPYSLSEFPINVLDNVHDMVSHLKKNGEFEPFDEPEMTAEQLHRDRIVSVFHKLDELDNHTKTEWFTKLTLKNLNKFYHIMIDIWNYRAGLNNTMREAIVPGGQLFKLDQIQLSQIKDRKKVQKIIIGVIDKLISSAPLRSDKVLGSLYVLTALSEVSKDCAQANQFLLQ